MITQYFRSITVDTNTVLADTHGSDLLLIAGTNISLAADAALGQLTIGISSEASFPISITADNSTNATNYVIFNNASTGNLTPRTDTDFYYNPSTGALTVTAISSARVIPRVTGITSSATITPPGDTVDQYNITALAVPATIAIPSGTPSDGQKLVLRIKDNGNTRALTWTSSGTNSYRVVGTTLPTTTVVSKVLYIGCIYNATESFWDVIAVAQQA